MSGIHLFYIILVVIFLSFLTYMFWWNKREK